MMNATVRLFWTPSVSADVVEQNIVVKENGVVVAEETLSPAASEFLVDLGEKANVEVVVSVTDGYFTADAQLTFVVPDLTEPLPVTGLGWEILDVFDDEEYAVDEEDEEPIVEEPPVEEVINDFVPEPPIEG